MDVQALKIERTAAPQRRRSRRGKGVPWWTLGGLAVLAALAFVFREPLRRSVDAVTLPRVALHRVALSRPAEAGAVQGTAANGYVVAARRAALSADTPGRIDELNVVEGSRVERGQVVARLFQGEFAAALARAEAVLNTAVASVARAEAAVGTARATVAQRTAELEAAENDVADAASRVALAAARIERIRDLVAAEIAAQDELDAAVSNLDGNRAQERAATARFQAARTAVEAAKALVAEAEAQVAVVRAGIDEARAARDLAAATLDKTEVRAPFDGVVVLKDAEIGEVVSPNSQGGSNARGSVCTMVDFDSLEVQADVPESSLKAVRLGGPVRIFLDAFPERVYTGRVDRIWPTANRQKATVEVRARFDARDDLLRPEMGVRVVFLPETEADADGAAAANVEPVIMVPEDALVRIDGADAVYVYEQGVARRRAVATGARDGRRVVVTSGVVPGDRVVVAPPAELADGGRVLVADDG